MTVALDPTVTASDAELAARLAAGDLDALVPIYRRHGTAMLRLALRLTGSREDAEEVVQDVFVGLAVALRRYEEAGRFDAWLRRITARTAIDRLDRAARRREVALEEGGADWPAGDATLDATVADRVTLERAIAALPDTLRVVFVLRMVEQYTHAEIATTLGIRRGTSEVRLHRALRMLRHTLGDR